MDRLSGVSPKTSVPGSPHDWMKTEARYVYPPYDAVKINWGRAVLYGLMMALLGGIIWGVIDAVIGYISTFVAIGIGLAVAWSTKKGAGNVTKGVMALSAILIIFSIFFGTIVALTIVASEFGLSILDVLAFYPEIIAFAPTEFALTYIFGLIGMIVGLIYLWSEMKYKRKIAVPYPGFDASSYGSQQTSYQTPTATGLQTPSFGQQLMHSTKPVVQKHQRETFRAMVQIQFQHPQSHMLVAEYETMTGKAFVWLDGSEVVNIRVWGRQKTTEVLLEGNPPSTVTLKFRGVVTPHIDVSVDGTYISTF